MSYEKPQIADFGTILELTAAAGSLGTEDGAGGKTLDVGVGGIVSLSLGLLP